MSLDETGRQTLTAQSVALVVPARQVRKAHGEGSTKTCILGTQKCSYNDVIQQQSLLRQSGLYNHGTQLSK